MVKRQKKQHQQSAVLAEDDNDLGNNSWYKETKEEAAAISGFRAKSISVPTKNARVYSSNTESRSTRKRHNELHKYSINK